MSSTVKLLRRQGYAATGVSDILRLAGAPKGSLYYHFPGGKSELAAAAVTEAGALVTRTLEEIAAAADGPADFMARYCTLLGRWLEESGFRSGCPIATTLLETAPQSEIIRAAGARALDDWVAVIAAVFGADRRLPAAAARHRATLVIAAVEGALMLARTHRSTEPLAQVRDELISLCET